MVPGCALPEMQRADLFALDHSDGEVRPAAPGKLLLTCLLSECRQPGRLQYSHDFTFSKETICRNGIEGEQ